MQFLSICSQSIFQVSGSTGIYSVIKLDTEIHQNHFKDIVFICAFQIQIHRHTCIQICVSSPLLFSHSVMSNSLQPHGLQHPRLPCLSLSPTVCSKFMFIDMMTSSNNPILCQHLLLWPSVFPSTRFISSESTLHIRWPKYWRIIPLFYTNSILHLFHLCVFEIDLYQ